MTSTLFSGGEVPLGACRETEGSGPAPLELEKYEWGVIAITPTVLIVATVRNNGGEAGTGTLVGEVNMEDGSTIPHSTQFTVEGGETTEAELEIIVRGIFTQDDVREVDAWLE